LDQHRLPQDHRLLPHLPNHQHPPRSRPPRPHSPPLGGGYMEHNHQCRRPTRRVRPGCLPRLAFCRKCCEDVLSNVASGRKGPGAKCGVDHRGECVGVFDMEVEWLRTFVSLQEAKGVTRLYDELRML
jgi:hypothetical protein